MVLGGAGLLRKRLVFVTGKGGVGKSTVAAALGIAAARRGRRTIIAELSGAPGALSALGQDGECSLEVELEPGLSAVSIDPQDAMEEYLRLQAGRLGGLLGASTIFQYLAAAAPGLRELVTIGKVWELAQPERLRRGAPGYDLVIVDAPASGHAVALLQTPRTYSGIARAGPVAEQAHAIHGLLADHRLSGLVLVAVPEEMSVNETLSVHDELAREPGIAFDAVIANRVYPARFSDGAARRLSAALKSPRGLQAETALRAALSEHRRRRFQEAEVARLGAGIGSSPLELPFLFSSRLGRAALERLADVIEGAL
jgi:anion-transporting  ArsA/GET3 family ATPase